MEKTIDKILDILASNDSYVSGEYIGNMLGISRIAVNKQVKKLIDGGVQIEISRKGYKYIAGDSLTVPTLSKKLQSVGIDIPIFVQEVVSTNTEAKKIYPKINSNFLFVAPRQISGRGRLDRTFVSAQGGVYMTLCYKPNNILVSDSLKIVLLTGLAVAKALQNYTQNVAIKWPNDVFVNGKKICGILLESVVVENMTQAIFLGIGINITNEIPFELREKVTSLELEGIVGVSREQMIADVMKNLMSMLGEYQNGGFENFEQEYKSISMTIGRNVVVNVNGQKKCGFGVGLSEEGYLLLQNDKGIIEKIILGDIEV